MLKIKLTSFKFSVGFIENVIKLCGAAAYFSLNDLEHVHIYTNQGENGFYSKLQIVKETITGGRDSN